MGFNFGSPGWLYRVRRRLGLSGKQLHVYVPSAFNTGVTGNVFIANVPQHQAMILIHFHNLVRLEKQVIISGERLRCRLRHFTNQRELIK